MLTMAERQLVNSVQSVLIAVRGRVIVDGVTPRERRRFWHKVRKSDGCWEWIGNRSPQGYGRVSFRYRYALAHRVAWALAHGPIPQGLIIMHKCDNPPCVRVSHLQLGTVADNNADALAKGRRAHQRGTLYVPRLSGEIHPHAKLTTEQVIAIRDARDRGDDALRLAQQYGVSRNQIYLIGRRKSWTKVA